jgi:hypothetical protein
LYRPKLAGGSRAGLDDFMWVGGVGTWDCGPTLEITMLSGRREFGWRDGISGDMMGPLSGAAGTGEEAHAHGKRGRGTRLPRLGARRDLSTPLLDKEGSGEVLRNPPRPPLGKGGKERTKSEKLRREKEDTG